MKRIRQLLGTQQILAFLETITNRDALQATLNPSLDSSIHEGARRLLMEISSEAWIHVSLNGEEGDWPAATLRTMRHCLWIGDSGVEVWVETAHISRMASWLEEAPNGILIDVGAATGAASIPIKQRVGDDLRVIAFEPVGTARHLLESTIERNGLTGIDVRGCAVSDSTGETEFIEYFEDGDDSPAYRPELSTIAYASAPLEKACIFRVQKTTLDSLIHDPALRNRSRIVVKVDVEGFEIEVIKGAADFLTTFLPYLSIDIHSKPGGGDTTEFDVIHFLKPLGYTFEKLDHVLLAVPPNTQ